MKSLYDHINLKSIPNHVAVIMDGNGRWAKKQGENRLFGHHSGVKSVRKVLQAARRVGVKYLTLYTFSSENWNRPDSEVEGLMNLFVNTITSEIEELHQNGVKISVIGNTQKLPAMAKQALQSAMDYTQNNEKINLVLALSYSAREEITQAVKQIATKIENKEISSDNITENLVSSHLYTHHIPDPELVIRTSGESRISNFLLWQIAYSELYFTDILWPDFNEEAFYSAIIDYQQRERRYGKTSEQIKNENA